MKSARKRKLYLVGIDSTPLWIIKKLAKTYKLNGFKLFEDNGVLKEIESTMPPVTNTAWPTIYTGLEPSEHRSMDFSAINKDYSKELLYYDTSKYKPFWDIIAEMGLKSLVITPAVALQKSAHNNVDMITGWPLRPRFSSAAIERAAREFGFDGEPDIGNSLNKNRVSLKDASKEYAESIRKRAEVSKYLIERNNYDLSFVCFTETDRIQHYTLNLKDWKQYVAPLYKEISDFIEYLDSRSKKLKEDAIIMVVSDHGAQRIHHKFLSNAWLAQNNYAVLKDYVYEKEIGTPKSKNLMAKVKSRIVDQLVESKVRRALYTKMPKALKRMGEKFVEESHDYEYEGKYVRIMESDFDMGKTKAFCAISSGIVGMVLINDSRFSNPCVSERQRNVLKKELMDKLSKIKDLDNRKLMKNVYDGRKYFPQKEDLISPDIIFELNDGYTADYYGYSKDKLYFEPEVNRRGEHSKMGIFGIMGYNNRMNFKNLKNTELNLTNVSPTILKYFGADSRKINGKPLIK